QRQPIAAESLPGLAHADSQKALMLIPLASPRPSQARQIYPGNGTRIWLPPFAGPGYNPDHAFKILALSRRLPALTLPQWGRANSANARLSQFRQVGKALQSGAAQSPRFFRACDLASVLPGNS